ncbi:MAG: winged helix-turn-helix transcriptional regulator [Nanoarchaeales archaeon]|nr:winged helix-turn-helix transcriptional regulator [Nanoarchaeales archaeon]
MNEQIKQTLSNFGLDKIEIQIYLYILQNGDSSQQEITHKTGLLRQTIYDRVRTLESKGILSKIKKDLKPFYKAISPEIFLEQIKEKEQEIIKILPVLNKLKKVSNTKTSSSTFTGLKALKKLMLLTLTQNKEILWIANKENNDEIFSDYFWHNYGARRIEKDITIKLLIEPTTNKDWKTDKKLKRFTKTNGFVKEKNSSMILFNNQVILYSIEQGTYTGTHITDNNLYLFFKEIFNKLYNEGKKI